MTELATLGGGCFWCTEAALNQLEGVTSAISGYCGGQLAAPDYNAVCEGTTGHAEVVQISFDPSVISYATLLQAFFTIHDPTTLNRQGHDVGSQYRSVIFTHSLEQEATARQLLQTLEQNKVWNAPIVTEILPAGQFWPAEPYHQNYFANNPNQPYCVAVVGSKVAKLKKVFSERLKHQ